MRMEDLSKFGFNDTPGDIENDMKYNKDAIDPLFLELVSKWPLKKINDYIVISVIINN